MGGGEQLIPPAGVAQSCRNEQGLGLDARHAKSSWATSLEALRTKEGGRVPVPSAVATSLPGSPSTHSSQLATNYQECGGLPV